MAKAPKHQEPKEEKDLESMILDYSRDKYKLVRTGVRWAHEIRQKENLPDPISALIPRALQEILSGAVPISEIEKLPEIPRSASLPAAPALPKLTKSDKTAE